MRILAAFVLATLSTGCGKIYCCEGGAVYLSAADFCIGDNTGCTILEARSDIAFTRDSLARFDDLNAKATCTNASFERAGSPPTTPERPPEGAACVARVKAYYADRLEHLERNLATARERLGETRVKE